MKARYSEDAITFLRQLSAQDLMKSLPNNIEDRLPLISPNIDGWVIPRLPAEIFAEGQQASISMIVGTTSHEFSSSSSLDELRKYIENFTGNLAPHALSLYGLADNGKGTSDPIYGTAADQWFVDVFRCPVAAQAQFHSAAHQRAYEYEFQHAIPGQGPKELSTPRTFPTYSGFIPSPAIHPAISPAPITSWRN